MASLKSESVDTEAVAKQNVPSMAISTIGIFFEKYATFGAAAREIMRASAGVSPADAGSVSQISGWVLTRNNLRRGARPSLHPTNVR